MRIIYIESEEGFNKFPQVYQPLPKYINVR
jgi:hypothetical protein